MAKQAHMSKEARFQQVIEAVIVIESRGKGVTAAKIARHLKMSASTHLRKIIQSAIEAGYVKRSDARHWNGRNKITYWADHAKLNKDCNDWYWEVLSKNLVPAHLTVMSEKYQ